MHQSQDLACSRCQYLGPTSNNTEACDAYCDDQDNIITIRSPKDVLCNFHLCEVKVYGQTFRSSEHAFQWKLCSHVCRDDLAQEVLDAHTPEQAKEIASRIPSHLRGSWHKIKSNVMEEILEAKTINCPEFKKALINSLGKHLVEAVKLDIFWSCGLNPRDAKTTKSSYHP